MKQAARTRTVSVLPCERKRSPARSSQPDRTTRSFFVPASTRRTSLCGPGESLRGAAYQTTWRPRYANKKGLTANRVHQSLGLDEPGCVDLVSFPLCGDAGSQSRRDFRVGRATAEQGTDVGLLER